MEMLSEEERKELIQKLLNSQNHEEAFQCMDRLTDGTDNHKIVMSLIMAISDIGANGKPNLSVAAAATRVFEVAVHITLGLELVYPEEFTLFGPAMIYDSRDRQRAMGTVRAMHAFLMKGQDGADGEAIDPFVHPLRRKLEKRNVN